MNTEVVPATTTQTTLGGNGQTTNKTRKTNQKQRKYNYSVAVPTHHKHGKFPMGTTGLGPSSNSG